MPDLDDVYRKFGEVAEAAQLVETELGNILLWEEGMAADLLSKPDPSLARKIHDAVNRHTTLQLLRKVKSHEVEIDNLDALLKEAVIERNRLFHSFYREHNFRRNSAEGCQVMLDDLEKMHDTILDAYKQLMLLSGIDLEMMEIQTHPTTHVKI